MQVMSENEMPNSNLNLILLGKPGAGKSATGNTILGGKAFELRRRPTSVTQDVAVKSVPLCNYVTITVYDTPGYTDLPECEIQRKYQNIFQKCESGPCVFLIVIKADTFTQKDREDLKNIEKALGEERLKKTWILFTRGDELEEENKTIDEFINDLQPLKEHLQKYDQRYHVFNNKKPEQKEVQILLTKFLNKSVGCPDINQNIPGYNNANKRIVILGKSGFGKSAAGNTILGQKEFNSEQKTSSVTRKCSEKHATVSGRSVSVVDTPGFFDTEMKPEELMTEIARSIYLSSPGPHAFLIVFRVIDRFTEQEQQITEQIKTLFGQGVLKYSIILFTHADQLDGKSVEELIEESSRLRDLVGQCGGRYHIFNNRDLNNRDQVNDLLKKIDTMIEENGGGHYSNQMYEDAERFRRENKFENFLSKYLYYFRLAAIILCVIGGAVVGATVGGVVGTCVASPIKGVVVGGVLGAVAGGGLVGAATAGFDVRKADRYLTSAPSSVKGKAAFSPMSKADVGDLLSELLKGLL